MSSVVVGDTAYEVDITAERLQLFDHTRIFLGNRRPLGGPGSRVAVMLSYNGSAWLNTAIVSIYLVGNRVRVKFASRGSHIAKLTESLYAPIFGNDIVFDYSSGKDFMDRA